MWAGRVLDHLFHSSEEACWVEVQSSGCLPCLDLLSAEFVCEAEIISNTCTQNGLKDAFYHRPQTLLKAEPYLFQVWFGIGHKNTYKFKLLPWRRLFLPTCGPLQNLTNQKTFLLVYSDCHHKWVQTWCLHRDLVSSCFWGPSPVLRYQQEYMPFRGFCCWGRFSGENQLLVSSFPVFGSSRCSVTCGRISPVPASAFRLPSSPVHLHLLSLCILL